MKKVIATILLWTAGISAFTLEFALAIYIHENWPALEAPGAFIFLVVSVILGILSLRAMRAHRSSVEKLAGWGFLLCIGLSIAFAIFHGWGDAVRIFYAVVAVAFFLGVIWFVRQSVRRVSPDMASSIASDLGEPSEQAILADAVEPYILYPAKWKIARRLLILLAITAACGVGCAWMLTLSDRRMVVAGFCLAFLAALCGLTCFLLIYRLVSRKPALVVTHLGLIDGASALYRGVGPIWWEEIRNVTIYTTPKTFLRPHYRNLDITPMNAQALLRRQPLMRRFLLRFFSPIPLVWLGCHIPAWMFSQSLETILEQIERIAWGDKGRQIYYGLPGEGDEGSAADAIASE